MHVQRIAVIARIARTAFIGPVAVLDGRSGQANATCEKKESRYHLEAKGDVSFVFKRLVLEPPRQHANFDSLNF
jgi:hypothetical protein